VEGQDLGKKPKRQKNAVENVPPAVKTKRKEGNKRIAKHI